MSNWREPLEIHPASPRDEAALRWLEDLPDPDNVGQSEYRIIHELLWDALEGCDVEQGGDPDSNCVEVADHTLAVLAEIERNAKELREQLVEVLQ